MVSIQKSVLGRLGTVGIITPICVGFATSLYNFKLYLDFCQALINWISLKCTSPTSLQLYIRSPYEDSCSFHILITRDPVQTFTTSRFLKSVISPQSTIPSTALHTPISVFLCKLQTPVDQTTMLFSSVKPSLHTPFPSSFPSFLPFSSLSFSLPFSPLPSFTPKPYKPPYKPSHLPAIRAIDAAQPFDYESHLRSEYVRKTSLKIAIIGFGNFGQFLAKTFSKHNHTLIVYSRSDYSNIARQLDAEFCSDLHDLCELHPDVVVISTSILSTESVVKSIPFQRLRRSTLFVDVLSVKEFPMNLFLNYLPQGFDILCTHPMFGPQSGKDSWVGLPFVYDRVRIGDDEERLSRVERFLDIFAKEGCRMVEMSCVEHDRHAAGSQFVTHTMGRVLERFGVESSPINTKGYETLLNLVDNTKGDSFDLYYGLFMYNKNSLEQLERLDMAFESLKKELFGQLLQASRKQLFLTAEENKIPSPAKLLRGGGTVGEPPQQSERLEGS